MKYGVKKTKKQLRAYSSIIILFQDSHEILRDLEIKTTCEIKLNRPDAVVKPKKERKRQVITIAIPQDHNVALKED